MTTSGKENFRLKSYKNKSLNPDEMRRRREEEGLQLRKQKREEQQSSQSCRMSMGEPAAEEETSGAALQSSWPQCLNQIRRRKKRTQDDMFQEIL